MNDLAIKLFNNGDNDGDTIIISSDEKSLKCHSFVIYNLSQFFKCCIDFNNQNKDGKKIINLSYPEKLIKLFDELQFNFNIDKNIQKLRLDFYSQLNTNNWLDLLIFVFDIDLYKNIQDIILKYYKSYILPNNSVDKNMDLLYKTKYSIQIKKQLIRKIFER